MLSMTGYGKGEYKVGGVELTCEIKTVNNRYLDVNVKAPRIFTAYEDVIRKLVREKMDDGQLNESELTFSDLDKICSTFSTVLAGVHHERIEYPDIALPPRDMLPEETAEESTAESSEDAQNTEVEASGN